MLKKLNIIEFRQFNNKEIIIGKKLTVISGQNATGKSTILGMIANSCEYKINEGKPILQTQFRAEWSDIFKGSVNHDPHHSNVLQITYQLPDNYVIDFRTTWQKEEITQDRFRMIPKRKRRPEDIGYGVKKDTTEAKLKYPVLYLGLSRLFPIGESSGAIDNKAIGMSSDEEQWFKTSYKNIVKINETINAVESLELSEIKKNMHAGIDTDRYDVIGNSSGQNNISQILMAILSFKRISSSTGYKGGLLLIDEFESTIHPAVQINLLKFILNAVDDLKLQVVITTHSTSILDFVYSKTKRNEQNQNNMVEYYYLTNSNGGLSIKRNPDNSAVYADMHNISSILDSSFRRLTVYSEDEEARWFINKLFIKYVHYLQLIEINVGCDELLNFDKCDPSYFSRVMIILDGDKEIDLTLSKNLNKLKLPGSCRPEEVIYRYIMDLDPEHEYLETHFGIMSKQTIDSTGPFSDIYSAYTDDRDKYKKWFNDNRLIFEQTNVLDYWIHDNKSEYDQLIENFKYRYNILAGRNSIRKII